MPDDDKTETVRIVALVAYSDNGRRIGENHHKARMTDKEVELCWQLHEEGNGTRRIAKILGHPRSTICDVLTCRTRAQIAERHRMALVVKRIKKGSPS